MSGSVGAVRKWLQQGGHADTVYQARADDISAIYLGDLNRRFISALYISAIYLGYLSRQSAYGWDVGPDWLFTRPNDGATVLNYVATWTDVIGPSVRTTTT